MARSLTKEIEETQRKLEMERQRIRAKAAQLDADSKLKALQRQVDHLISEQNRNRRS